MSNPSLITLQQRVNASAEQWAALAWQLVCDLRVAVPCIVKSFDPAKQTITAQPVIRENILQDLVVTPVDLPLLVDIPVCFPRAGIYALTFPIQPGDECLVIFADMCYNAWWQNGGEKNLQETKRRHDLSDGIAIFGIWSQPRVLQNYSEDTAQLRNENGGTFIEIDGDTVNIVTDNNANLNVTIAGNATIHADGDANIDADGDINLSADGDVNIGATGDVVIKGKNFLTHKHTGVQTGGGNTGNVL